MRPRNPPVPYTEINTQPHHPPTHIPVREARRRRTERAPAERPRERVTRRPLRGHDEDVRAAAERLLAARGAGAGDGIRDKNVREDDEVSGGNAVDASSTSNTRVATSMF